MMALTLFELNNIVRSVLELQLDQAYWIQAELSSVSVRGPHCYVEFVQKAERGNTFVAKARGQIWANVWMALRPYFERVTGQTLRAGMQVMVQVEVTFHEVYGLSLNVLDINPTFTLGDIARRRQEIVSQLQAEGIYNMNRELPLPRLLQRIAVISSDSAAGYGDFMSQLTNNRYGLAFHVKLFPAIMQGERVEQSIIAALNAIMQEVEQWDAVVIIRGGGATSDLTGFDTLALAENVAQFPLPVITGIGHERDDTVLDLISHTRVKTPTATAEFILYHQHEQLLQLEQLRNALANDTAQLLNRHRQRLDHLTARIPTLFDLCKTRHEQRLEMLKAKILTGIASLTDRQRFRLQTLDETLRQSTAKYFERQHHRLEILQTSFVAADPHHLLRLGFSIVRKDGHAVRSADQLQPGDTLHITFAEGTAEAVVGDENKKIK